MPYYNKHGLVISGIWKCIVRYISGSLLLDLIINTGLPATLYKYFNNDSTSTILVVISSAFTQLYILIGVFNYTADTCKTNFTLITVSIYYSVRILPSFNIATVDETYLVNII